MPNIYGARGTSTLGDLRKYDVSDKLWLIDADYATLAFFARKLAKKPTTDPEFRWFEKASPSRQDSINNPGGYSNTATTITVADGSKFKAGMVIQNVNTGEQMRVAAVSGNNLTVVRGWGTTPAAAISNNDTIVILGNANAEGASVPLSLTSQAVKKVNFTQIFREPFEVTGTESATEIYAGGSDLAKLREEHLQLHLKDIERAFFFGEPKEDISGPQPIRATGGLRYWITTNVETQTDLTNAEFEAWIRRVFAKGGDKKLGFLSPLIASAVNSWAAGKLNMFPKDKTYGIAVTNYLSIHGELNFVVEKLFAENPIYNGYAFAVDMDCVAYRYLNGNGNNRDTKLLKNRQNPGDDKIIEEYFSEVGLELALEDRHGFLKGVQTYS